MLEDNNALTHCQEVLDLPADPEEKLTYMGIQLKKTEADVESFNHTKELFIRELLSNLDRRFPADGVYEHFIMKNINFTSTSHAISIMSQLQMA